MNRLATSVTAAILFWTAAPAAAQDYQQLVTRPEAYYGRTVRVIGKVIQAAPMSSSGDVALRVNMTRGRFDVWTDTVWVDIPKDVAKMFPIGDGAMVEVYGRYVGTKSYQAVSGATISLPHVVACDARPFTPGVVTPPKTC